MWRQWQEASEKRQGRKNIPVVLEDSEAGRVPLPVSMPRGETLLSHLQGGAAKGSAGTDCVHCCHFVLFEAVVRSHKYFSGCDEDDQFP